MARTAPSIPSTGRPWLTMGLVGALAAVVALSAQNRHLRDQAAGLIRDSRLLKEGSFVPTVRVSTVVADGLSGDSLTLGRPQPGSFQALFFFTTTCPFCRESLPDVKRIALGLSKDISFAAVALDGATETATYIRQHELDFPVAVLDDEPRTRALYRTGAVPLIVLIDSFGMVIYSNLGPVSADDR